MSRMQVTKLQVDVLVQAAMFGPMGATHWTPLVEDPDALGRDLLSSGRRTSGERNAEDYVFEPLPIGITAIEAIKACSYYRYQRAKTPAIVGRIRDRMIDHLEGAQDAPWGWTAEDVARRLGRPAPGSDLPAPPPAALTEVADKLAEAGIDARTVTPVVSEAVELQAGGAGEFHGAIVGLHADHGATRAWAAQIEVWVAKDSDVAAKVFPLAVARIAWNKVRYTEVRRVGNLLVMAALPPWDDAEAAVALDTIGPPDERWSTSETPLSSGPAELVGSHIEMTEGGTVVATNSSQLEHLLDRLLDPAVKDQLRDVDLSQHSILALPGVELGRVVGAALVRSASGIEGAAKMTEDLVITYVPPEQSPTVSGSIVITPRQRRRPAYVRATEDARNRFHGWWRGTSALR